MDSSVSRRSSNPEPVPDAGFGHTVSDLVPRRCTLDGFAEEVAFTEGINLREAEPLVPILVTTQNSRYRIIPLRWGDSDVLVQGGLFFPEPTEARLTGSTFGGRDQGGPIRHEQGRTDGREDAYGSTGQGNLPRP